VNQSPALFEKHILVEADSMSAVDLLAEATDFSRQRIKQIMQKGAVWVTLASGSEKNAQRLRRAKKILQPGDTLHLYYDEKILAEEPPIPELIADEGTYSVWYKPYGLRSQGSKWSDHCTIARWVETHLEPQRPAFVVHRLDRAATGLIIIAHKKSTATQLSRMFAKREIEKRYRVVVHGRFPDTPEPYTMTQAIDERAAVSHATLLEYDAEQDRSLLEVNIETGRKHQIRRHLAWAGFPVVGDRLYGDAAVGICSEENLQLTACYLRFSDPAAGPVDSPWGQRAKSKKEYRLDDARIVSLARITVNDRV
jgi:tRNA pseudouridine32 synthase/23S rRNA pseudouridine746 synthase